MLRVKRLFKSVTYALKGFRKAYREEQNIRIQVIIGTFILLLTFFMGLNRIESSIIIFLVVLVILMELANSAVERIADVLKPRINTYIKEIKDIMAAAVLLASVMSVVVGLIIFWPYFVK